MCVKEQLHKHTHTHTRLEILIRAKESLSLRSVKVAYIASSLRFCSQKLHALSAAVATPRNRLRLMVL